MRKAVRSDRLVVLSDTDSGLHSLTFHSFEDLKAGEPELEEEWDRPKTRGDCLPGGCNQQRPCPWVACKFHLYLDVNPDTGTIKLNFPDLEPHEMKTSCSLDKVDRGAMTLDEIGDTMNITRERIRQLEVLIILKVRAANPDMEDPDERSGYTYPAP